MAKLKKEIQLFIVQLLAVFNTPSEVAAAVKENFEVEISRPQAISYDASRAQCQMSQDLKDLFHKTRADFLAEKTTIPVLTKHYRAGIIQKGVENLLKNGAGRLNWKLMLSLLEHAAREEGGMFTNRRELTGANGKDLISPAEIAKEVYKELMEDAGFTAEEAMAFVKDRYKVEDHEIVSEANN